jgi:hypothetical protein
MSKDVRRIHPRVSYDERIRLLDDDGRPLLVGRTLNLSPSGIYVRAPNGCEVGSEVTCDLPLPGGRRQLRGRVTRTQPLPDESTGIGIQFVDLTTGDSSSLHRALEGNGPRPVAVKVLFEGMANPVKCHGVVTAEGLRLDATLPFLRLGSDVKAVYDGYDAKIDARGVLTGVRLEPMGSDGVPRLGVDVEIESEMAIEPSSSQPSSLQPSGESREDASAGGAFTTWDPPPITAGYAEPPVVTDPGLEEGEGREVTAIVNTPSFWEVLAARFERFPAWGLAIVVFVAFGVVYAGIEGLPPRSGASRQLERAGSDPSSATPPNAAGTLQPLIVPSAGWPGGARVEPAAPTAAAAPAGAPAPLAAAPGTLAGVDEPVAVAPPHRHGRPPAARPRPPGSPFLLDDSSGRSDLRPGASPETKGEPLPGLGGVAALDGAAGAKVRGTHVAVESSSLYLEVTLPRPESDGKFRVQVTPSWPTTLAIAGKSATGFTVSFGTPAPPEAHLDWRLVR